MDFSIEGFWKKTFAGVEKPVLIKDYAGWKGNCTGEESYISARLSLREGYDDLETNIWLIAAPGAVGKSTLASQICSETGAVYLDLATAATVGGNCITGGLVHAGVLPSWASGKAALIIDALDEARLRVTQPAFEDFLKDVVAAAQLGKYPVVLLGRVGIIEEAWSILAEQTGKEYPILNIELFDEVQSVDFVMARLYKFSKSKPEKSQFEYPHLERALDNHRGVYEEAIRNVVVGLKQLAHDDENTFVGYAPVLDAIAKVIAAEPNPSKLNEELRQVLEGEVLTQLSNEILTRETGKLVDQLATSYSSLPDGLYTPAEQLERLACRLFKLPAPTPPMGLTPQQSAAYIEAIQTLLPQHPFLDGTGLAPSSAVFAANIIATALRSNREELRRNGEQYPKFTHHAPNPFLIDFYGAGEGDLVKSEHVGLIFESVLAKSKIGESVRLSIVDEQPGVVSVEIVRSDAKREISSLEFLADSSGVVRLGRRLSNVFIEAEDLYLELGTGEVLELVSPVSISCSILQLSCISVVAKSDAGDEEGVINLEALEVVTDPALAAPIVREGVSLQVTWPDSGVYPWTEFSLAETQVFDPDLSRMLRIFRRLVMAFRSHSKGRLARFRDKIEHSRMLKGEDGRRLLEKLSKDKVLSLEGAMYYLDADALGAKTGASFLDVNLKNYSQETLDYVRTVIA